MKRCNLVFLLSALILLTASGCKKHKQEDELSKLPPETHTGARTMGALVNGKAFKPSGSVFAGPYLQSNYIYMNGGYNFTLSGSKQNDEDIQIISIFTTNLPIKEGQTLKLDSYAEDGKASGIQELITGLGDQNLYQTNATLTGELHITKFDEYKHIVSGTFFYDAVNPAGDVVHVTNGRFDMPFTR